MTRPRRVAAGRGGGGSRILLHNDVTKQDFRKNDRGELGTRTATLHREGVARFRESWLFRAE